MQLNKIAIIGYGNMGNLLLNNFLNLNLFKEENIIISTRNPKKSKKIDDLIKIYPKITLSSSNEFVAKLSEKIFICVETFQLKTILEEIKPFINKNTHIIHCCAGISFKMISKVIDAKVSQIIPTTVSQVDNNLKSFKDNKNGITLISHNDNVLDVDKKFLENLFENFTYINVFDNQKLDDERNLEIATILSSCGPALIAMMINQIINISIENSSLNHNELEYILIKTIKSTAIKLDTDNNMSITDMINKTATKGGITQIGIDYIEENNQIINDFLNILLNKYDIVKKELNNQYDLDSK
ncbi:MAG: NAD(P)-binding domain-containing protein [Methanobrevibacter sp.]|jgi:pyrroline-5-carboxylate reductase|nr:NAD(P)-binding domain-containing protein [Candidatus Methanoflexus mossambicus]